MEAARARLQPDQRRRRRPRAGAVKLQEWLARHDVEVFLFWIVVGVLGWICH
jgi:hypothetical protein